MILDNLPNILNMIIRRVENFLRVFEKMFTSKIGIFERKDMVLYNLPDLLNMVIRRVENFLRVFQKKFWAKKQTFFDHSHIATDSILRADFSKILIFSRFLPYNSSDVSYDSNSFSSVKIWSCTTFQMCWTWSYDP